MLEKPDLADEKITACLRESYGMHVSELKFLPLGYDASAGVYRVTAGDGISYFLKVKKGGVNAPSLTVPRYLKDQGISQVVAPLVTHDLKLWASIESFAAILYPFI